MSEYIIRMKKDKHRKCPDCQKWFWTDRSTYFCPNCKSRKNRGYQLPTEEDRMRTQKKMEAYR